MRRLIEVMGGAAPENTEGLTAALVQLLGGVGNAAAEAER
jgi:hypothetical protein